MNQYTDYVMVTDWETVDAEDFYLTDELWTKHIDPERLARAKELQAEGNLYVAYTVPAVCYVIFRQMGASQIFIDADASEIMSCGGAVIGCTHKEHFEYSY